MTKHIPLQDWAARHFEPAPSIRTLRSWARAGRIQPRPVLVGREYRAREDAVYVPAHRNLPPTPITVIESDDPIVNDIIASGPTQSRRQA